MLSPSFICSSCCRDFGDAFVIDFESESTDAPIAMTAVNYATIESMFAFANLQLARLIGSMERGLGLK